MAYATNDNRRDLMALRGKGVNSYAELIARIGIRDAIAAGAFHFLFLVLGVFALLSPPPPPEKQALSDAFSLGFIAMQAAIVGVQLWNQIDRERIRRRMRRE